MGVYYEQILPRLMERVMDTPGLARWRRRCVDGLAGIVVEPGFGSGPNVELYPPAVKQIYAIDPSAVAQVLAQDRIASSSVAIEHVGLDGQRIPLEDGSCDSGLLTFTLCTVADPDAMLSELRRVIRPGGSLHFLEHGLAPEAAVQRWQRRLEPTQKFLFDGCHLTRSVVELVERAGFDVVSSDSAYESRFKPSSWLTVGRAI